MTVSPSASRDPIALEMAEREELERNFRNSYNTARRRRVILRVGLNMFGVLLFLAFWEAIPRLVPSINKILFPPPSTVFSTFWPMLLSGEIPLNILASLRRAGAGFAIALVTGIAAGVFTARMRVAEYLTEPILHGFRSVPVIALVQTESLKLAVDQPGCSRRAS